MDYNSQKRQKRKGKTDLSMIDQMNSFLAFMYSSQFIANKLKNHFPQRCEFRCRNSEPPYALLEAMTNRVSFLSRFKLLALSGVRLTLIKRLVGSDLRHGLNNSLTMLSQGHKFIKPRNYACLTRNDYPNRMDKVFCVAFDRTGLLIATGYGDGIIKLWDLQSGPQNPYCLQSLNRHTDSVRCLMFDPTKFRLVSGGGDNTIIVWEAAKDGNWLVSSEPLLGHRSNITAIQFLKDGGDHLISGSFDGMLKIWRVPAVGNKEQTSCILSLKAHKSAVRSILLHPETGYIITAGEDRHVKVWRLMSKKDLSLNCISSEQNHLNIVTCLAIARTGIAVSGSWDDTMGIQNISSDGQLVSWQSSPIGVMVVSITFLHNGIFVITGCDDNCAKIWKLACGGKSFHLVASMQFSSSVISVALDPNGRGFAIGLNNGLTFLIS
ncbi:MAG: WD40 repeat domain-containing protein [Gammaproteobacteria bacterium]|nr:WD40 repeat domain-containing protein [Gammaproteobacteria bacterium]